MSDEKYIKRKRVTVGTIGHVDHGKMTLTAAIATVLAAKFAGNVEGVDPEASRKAIRQADKMSETYVPVSQEGYRRKPNGKRRRVW